MNALPDEPNGCTMGAEAPTEHTEAGADDMSATDTQTGSYVVRHPDLKGGRPVVFDSKEQAEQMLPALISFNRWLYAGGVPRKETRK